MFTSNTCMYACAGEDTDGAGQDSGPHMYVRLNHHAVGSALW